MNHHVLMPNGKTVTISGDSEAAQIANTIREYLAETTPGASRPSVQNAPVTQTVTTNEEEVLPMPSLATENNYFAAGAEPAAVDGEECLVPSSLENVAPPPAPAKKASPPPTPVWNDDEVCLSPPRLC